MPEGLDREVIIVNDCSTDTSAEVVERFMGTRPERITLLHHTVNQGKGAAIRTAIQHATGEYSLIQDADLEYDPREYGRLLYPLLELQADAVFGSRFLAAGEHRVLYFWHSVANRMLTLLSNIASDLNLTDMETCYKAFRTSLLKSIPIRSNRFGIEPEITIKLARRRARIYETPISYHGRTYDEGKKIGLKDAFDALWVIVKYRLTNDNYADPDAQILDALAHAPRFNQWMASSILPYVGQRVLEIGAGIGTLTRLLASRRSYYAATDADPERVEFLRRAFRYPHLEAWKCDVLERADVLAFRGVVDTIVLLNVLEHVADEATALENVFEALPSGGRAIILAPCGQEAFGTLDEVLGHRRRYARDQLLVACQRAGFEVEKILEFNRISRIPWLISGQLLKSRTISPSSIGLFDRFVPLWRKIDASLPWAPLTLIAIARRP